MYRKWRDWIWFPTSIAAGLWTTFVFWPYFDPITGSSITGNLIWIFLNAFLVGIAFFVCFRKGWRILSPFLILFFLLAGCPVASKAGLKLHLKNETDSLIEVRVKKTKSPNRRVDFQLLPNAERVYKTAPGDYSESIEVTIETAGREVAATIAQLRTNRVVYTSAGFELRAVAKR